MATEVMPNPSATTQAPAFSGAMPVQEAPFTSGLNPSTTIMAAAMGTSGSMASMNGAAGQFAAAMPTAALLVGGAAALLANL